MTNGKLLHTCLAAIGALASVSHGYGSSLSASAGCFQDNVTQDNHVSTTPGVGTSAALDHCNATAYADWSVLRVGGSSDLIQPVSPNSQQSNSGAEWVLFFRLFDPNLPADSARQFNLAINYDVTLTADQAGFPGVASTAGFSVHINNDPFTTPVNFQSSFDQFSGNVCPAPASTLPRCNGHYTGVGFYPVTFFYNTSGFNRLIVSASANTLDAIVDAMHSVSIGPLGLDSTSSFAYDDPGMGNPLGFQVASAVPEPSSVLLAVAGAVALALRRVVRRRG